ncbi:UDP-N-acetylmuramoyl-tripeptide--D-alanyl-D-alanine ligase [Helicobacter jaachi]|uniref:UDP-N-acetylmuramoyl-tripeptide--D-alanyl-D-alanine ligase n=1 Tax=Helicobacter jaachi TaxID=1677920 RepID=A0A4U8TE69_9HELI|nr:UDP-N-acetylmuramoyl-tripeptide--D-alanyl-D-alanine ligase [Helicobacter jaachi]TLD96977.1 UDP-N-acetylmuramoyl-tripeptide--D-alanyl-D-alanine ligase [Helicobacter jaachi]
MENMFIIDTIAQWVFVLCLAYYGMTNLQWYNYSFKRVFFMHHKRLWHLYYFIVPVIVYVGAFFIPTPVGDYILIALSVLYFLSIIVWSIKLDKKLNFTPRVVKFFIIFFIFMLLNESLCFLLDIDSGLLDLMPLVFASVISRIYERVLLNRYIVLAKEKLDIMSRLIIIGVTGSYGKTSIKNFLAQILKEKYRIYATPRSVNTYTGIIADINQNLDYTTEIYIVEAGARLKGDIAIISHFLNPHYAVIGEVGEQHLEYFKNLDNIIETKFELLQSTRLKKAFVFKDNPIPKHLDTKLQKKIVPFPEHVRNVEADLSGTKFELCIKNEWYSFETMVLGRFNVTNLSAAIYMGVELGLRIEDIQRAVKRIEPIPHRLNKIEINQKLIIDDGFNGNLKGMKEAIRLASLYEGRKIIVTPGIVESTKEANIELARAIDGVFDIAIITGELNAKILSSHIQRTQKIILKDKAMLEDMLKSCSQPRDLVLFSNDAPSYI